MEGKGVAQTDEIGSYHADDIKFYVTDNDFQCRVRPSYCVTFPIYKQFTSWTNIKSFIPDFWLLC